MPDPTPQDYEEARTICYYTENQASHNEGDFWVHPKKCPQCKAIATALVKQRKLDAKVVRAAGEAHADIIGENVPQRMAGIASCYLDSGWTAEEVRKHGQGS